MKIEKLKIEGKNSKLKTADTDMFSDGFIEVNNLNGNFALRGKISKLINQSKEKRLNIIKGAIDKSNYNLNFLKNLISYYSSESKNLSTKYFLFELMQPYFLFG